MTRHSKPRLLVLHAVRLLGFADTAAISGHAGVTIDAAAGLLAEAESRSWVQQFSFADLEGWSLTDEGKIENERQVATERDSADPEHQIAAAYRDFLPLNARLLRAITDWQITPTDADVFASNDHSDRDRDARILTELSALNRALAPLVERLSSVLARFGGYTERFESALNKGKNGHNEWIDRTDVDSCHRVWFQLHEDLIATLGIDRRTESTNRPG